MIVLILYNDTWKEKALIISIIIIAQVVKSVCFANIMCLVQKLPQATTVSGSSKSLESSRTSGTSVINVV